MARPRVAFHAPLKAPDHPSPSGDRRMARALLAALDRAGFDVDVPSRLRSHEPAGDAARQAGIRHEAEMEVERLLARWNAAPGERPDLWFTYHLYYKAPDLLGPAIAPRLGIPYAVAEASVASKRANGPWAAGHAAVVGALRQAATVFILNEADRDCVAALAVPRQQLPALPPFLERLPAMQRSPRAGPVRLLAVAMMRPGDKLASYRLLATALGLVADRDWSLTIVGDGEARAEVEATFAPFGERIAFLGRIDDDRRLDAIYSAHDILVWPAVNEAFGMALLEGQATGCPVVAGAFGGVAGVVRDGETGLLAAPGDGADFARKLARLVDEPDIRQAMGRAAARFVATERSLDGAAAILSRNLHPLLARTSAPSVQAGT